MITLHEKKLINDVLSRAELKKMPKANNASVWIWAIAKFRLQDGSFGYGIIHRNLSLGYEIKYINGNTSAIGSIIDVYPYETVDTRTIKRFKDDEDRGARVDYLKSENLPYLDIEKLEGMSIEDLNKEVVRVAVYKFLNNEE